MKNFLIIGASSGIGRATALQLAAEGNRVFATYHTHPQADMDQITYHQLDVLSAVQDWSFLPDTIDGLVYCVGSITLKPFHRFTTEDFLRDYQLQVMGAVTALQQALPALKNSTHPAVVLFSTVAVQTGFTFHSMVSSSKGALEGLTKALAAEWAPKIRVNCVAPSITSTPLAANLLSTPEKLEANAQRHPMKQIGDPADLAAWVCLLLSEKSKWVTGQVLHADGGMSSVR